MTEGIFILLGSNLGDRNNNLNQAKLKISESIGEIVRESAIYETAAWGVQDQPSFYNQVIEINSLQLPHQMLANILRIENKLGRIRREKWGSRTIDIDILYYNDLSINAEELQIPHPGIPSRRFTLIPLAEIAPDFIHPLLRKSNSVLLINCKDELTVKKVKGS